jgi:hypothetical protein
MISVFRIEKLIEMVLYFHVLYSVMVQTVQMDNQISTESHHIPDFFCKWTGTFTLCFSKMAHRTTISKARVLLQSAAAILKVFLSFLYLQK